MVKELRETSDTERAELIVKKYYNDFMIGDREYHWDLGKELEKVGLGIVNEYAENYIMNRIDEIKKIMGKQRI